MRVVCDNCGASYRIPDHKLVKEVNKATCRKCGEAIIIRKSAGMAVGDSQKEVDPEASTQVTELASLKGPSSEPEVAAIPSGPAMGHGFGQPANLPEDAGPPTVAQHMDFKDETIPRQDLPEPTAARPPAPPPPPAPAPPPSAPPTPPTPPRMPMPMSPSSATSPPPTPSPARAKKASTAASGHDFSGDLTVVMMSNFACAAGALFIVVAQESWHRPMGLFVCLAGAILSLCVVISSDRGRRPASMLMSYLVSFMVAGAAAFGLHTQENLGDSLAAAGNSDAVVARTDLLNPKFAELLEKPEKEDHLEKEDALVVPEVESNSKEPVEANPAVTPRSGTGAFPVGGAVKPVETPKPKASQDWDDDWNDDWEEPAPVRKDPPPPPPRRVEPEPEPEPEPDASEGVPLVVLDTMLRSNRKVKGCFVAYKRETGTMPSGRINVKFKVRPSGRPQEVRIAGGPYVNTSLDVCLGSAVSAIQFPPFEGESKTYTYPFVL
jgi:predicted Zn finger-like uncharacterized protein